MARPSVPRNPTRRCHWCGDAFSLCGDSDWTARICQPDFRIGASRLRFHCRHVASAMRCNWAATGLQQHRDWRVLLRCLSRKRRVEQRIDKPGLMGCSPPLSDFITGYKPGIWVDRQIAARCMARRDYVPYPPSYNHLRRAVGPSSCSATIRRVARACGSHEDGTGFRRATAWWSVAARPRDAVSGRPAVDTVCSAAERRAR